MRSVRVLAVGCAPGHAVCARFDRRASGQITLRRFAAVPVDTASVGRTEIECWGEALAKAVACVGAEAGAAVALPASVVAVRRVALPPLPPAQREKLLAFELQQVAAQPPEETVSAHVTVTEAPDHTRVVLAAARREAVEAWEATVRGAGLRVDRLEAGCAALYRAFCYNYSGSTGSTWTVIELGVRSLRVLLADHATYAVRTVVLNGGASATGTAPAFLPQSNLAAQATAERIHLELARLLAAQEATRPGDGRIVVQRILLTGEGAALPGLSEALAQRLVLPVERMDPLRGVEIDAGVDLGDHVDRLGELVGLALPATMTAPGLDLSPVSVRRERERRQRRPSLVLAGLALLVAPLPPGCLLVAETRAMRERAAELAGALRPLAVLQTELSARLNEEAGWRAKSDDVVSLLRTRTAWVDFMAELQDRWAAVDGVWFDGLAIVPGDDSDAAPRLRLTGRVRVEQAPGRSITDQARFTVQALLEGLRQSDYVEALESERFDTSQPDGLRFEAVFKLATGMAP